MALIPAISSADRYPCKKHAKKITFGMIHFARAEYQRADTASTPRNAARIASATTWLRVQAEKGDAARFRALAL